MSEKNDSAKIPKVTEKVAKDAPKEYSGEVISEFKTVGTKGTGEDAKADFITHKVGSTFKTKSKKGFENLQNEHKIKK